MLISAKLAKYNQVMAYAIVSGMLITVRLAFSLLVL